MYTVATSQKYASTGYMTSRSTRQVSSQ